MASMRDGVIVAPIGKLSLDIIIAFPMRLSSAYRTWIGRDPATMIWLFIDAMAAAAAL